MGEQNRVSRDRREAVDMTAPGRDQSCRALGRGAGPRVEAARAQTSAQFGNTFSTSFLIKQLIFNYESEAGSPHEMSYVIYQKKSSLGRYGR